MQSQMVSRRHEILLPISSELAASQPSHPKRSQVSERQNEDDKPNRQADKPIAHGEVHRMMRRRVVDQDAEDTAEGRREERREPCRRANQETGEPAETAHRNPEKVTSADGPRCG